MKKAMLIYAVCSFGGFASATVHGLEQLQVANSSIVYQYTFEGANLAERLDQKKSPDSPDLAQVKDTLTSDVSFANGWDSSSQAVGTLAGSLSSGRRQTGVALKTTNTLTMSTSGTIEYMVKADAISDQGGIVSGISGSSRWYFMHNTTTNKATMTLGANTPYDLIGGTAGVAYEANHWYYVAQTWDIVGTNVTMNAWVADMSLATPVLTQTIVNKTAGGAGGVTNQFRLGSLMDTDYFSDANLDAVAIYNTTLDSTTIISHFDALRATGVLNLYFLH
jgi:hypothetical protein